MAERQARALALIDGGQAGQVLADLRCFRALKKWTVARFARHWDTSEDTATPGRPPRRCAA